MSLDVVAITEEKKKATKFSSTSNYARAKHIYHVIF
jgi:hypothetical protein